MLIKVKDYEGNLYTNEMFNNDRTILEMHFCTSYTQVIVQTIETDENGKQTYPEKNIIIPLENASWVDMIAVSEDEIGEWA